MREEAYFWYKNAIIGYKRKSLETCEVGMKSEASFAAGQGRQKVRGAPGTTPPNISLSNLLGPGSSSRQLVVSFSSSHLPLLAALQGSSPWPWQALSRSGLGRPGGSYPTWQLAFALLSANKMKPPSRSKRAAVVCWGRFWSVSSSVALLFPLTSLPLSVSEAGVCI